jgi:diguanylate cyclase (GGDEF)-like protein
VGIHVPLRKISSNNDVDDGARFYRDPESREVASMFRSNLFLKVFSTIVLGVFLVTTSYYFFTVPLVNDMAFEAEKRAGLTVLDSIYLLIDHEHEEVSAFKKAQLKGHERELKAVLEIVLSYIHDIQKDINDGKISTSTAQEMILERVRSIKYAGNDYVWISDYDSKLISHPDPKLHKADFSSIKDVRGNLIVPPMIEEARNNGEGYYSYWWRRLGGEEDPVEKLSYFINMPEWQWVIGTGVYIDDIERAVNERKAELISKLKKHVHETKIAGQGYLYVFDSNKNMIIHPNPNIENTNFSKLLDPTTNQPIGDELIASIGKSDGQLRYEWDKPTDPGNYVYEKISWVRYYEPNDWYICSSVYTEDLKMSAKALTGRLLIVSAIAALFLSMVGGYFFAYTFSAPIKRIANVAIQVSKGELTMAPHYSRKDEIGVLARAFNDMVGQLRDQIKNLEERVAERTAELSGWVGKLERRNTSIETINSMGDMMQACKTYEEVYDVAVKTVSKLFPESAGHIMIFDDQGQTLVQTTGWNEGLQEYGGTFYEADDCWGLRRGKSHTAGVGDIGQICNHVNVSGEKIPPYICVPMVAQGEMFGVLHMRSQIVKEAGLESKGSSSNLRLIETVAEHTSLSLANMKLQKTLHEQSVKDMLTGLYNRRHLEEVLKREERRAKRHNISIGVLLLDVDFFKKVNDTYGHDAGDEVLRRLGALLDIEFRGEDTVCRYGGEEFMVVLPHADLEGSKTVAEKLREKIQQSIKIVWQGKELGITVSIGVAVYPDHADTIHKVVDCADSSLYKAKEAGRNCVQTV